MRQIVDAVLDDPFTLWRAGIVVFFGLAGFPGCLSVYREMGYGAAMLAFGCYMLLAWIAVKP